MGTKNNITNLSYFTKRLRDSGFYVSRLYTGYCDDDIRKWTVVVAPRHDSLFITCIDNGEWPYRGMYEIDDGGRKVPKGYYLNTDSIDVVIKHLADFNIICKNPINNSDGRRPTKEATKES
tara:strand:+ start:281 stop:643 length:363 start_codon:yes stop_codon:yes gene_type:complete